MNDFLIFTVQILSVVVTVGYVLCRVSSYIDKWLLIFVCVFVAYSIPQPIAVLTVLMPITLLLVLLIQKIRS